MTAHLAKEFLTQPAIRGRSLAGRHRRFAAWLTASIRGWREARRRRLAIRELSRFDRRILDDIGVAPGELDVVIDRLLRGPRPPF